MIWPALSSLFAFRRTMLLLDNCWAPIYYAIADKSIKLSLYARNDCYLLFLLYTCYHQLLKK